MTPTQAVTNPGQLMIEVRAAANPGQLTILLTALLMAVFDFAAFQGWVPASLRPTVVGIATVFIPMLLALFGYQYHQTLLQHQRLSVGQR
jgi:hypothetical protein